MCPSVRFTEEEAERAFHEWGCNCGPGALAAILDITLDEVRPLIPDFETKRYTSPTMMFAALRNSGRQWSRTWDPAPASNGRVSTWPCHGIVRIQWEGPWLAEGVPIAARYKYTHLIGAQILQGEVGVFDINCINNGSGWVALEEWSEIIVPYLTKHIKRATGKWHITHSLEVARRSTPFHIPEPIKGILRP